MEGCAQIREGFECQIKLPFHRQYKIVDMGICGHIYHLSTLCIVIDHLLCSSFPEVSGYTVVKSNK